MDKSSTSEYLKNLTTSPGVYKFLDKNERVIYIGKAKNLKKRVKSYFSTRQVDQKTRSLVSNISNISVVLVDTESDALLLENIVQFIEGTFYLWFIYFYEKNVDKVDIAKYRYYDWFLTTPTMLISTMMYFYYLLSKNNILTNITSYFKKHWAVSIVVIIANFAMLLMGYLTENSSITLIEGFIWGFVFFGIVFYAIYDSFIAKESMITGIQDTTIEKEENKKEIKNLFIFLTTIWGLYGIIFLLNDKWKNIGYNILDIISKNFYGLFIYWKIVLLSIK